jgi:uncharacterized protein YozE (UPF0346 family)
MTTFFEYLIERIPTNDPVGDLAEDMRRDGARPEHIRTIANLRRHLLTKNACPEAFDAADAAWREYGKLLQTGDRSLLAT